MNLIHALPTPCLAGSVLTLIRKVLLKDARASISEFSHL